MNCSFSRLRRGTMLVLLVPANSHITDSRSITRALQRNMSYFWRVNTNIWPKCKTRFRNVYLPVSAVLVLTLWSHSMEQLQNHGFPPRRNSAVKSERRSVRKINPRRGGSSDMRDAALIYSTDLSPPRRLWISCGPQYFLTGSPNISIPRLS